MLNILMSRAFAYIGMIIVCQGAAYFAFQDQAYFWVGVYGLVTLHLLLALYRTLTFNPSQSEDVERAARWRQQQAKREDAFMMLIPVLLGAEGGYRAYLDGNYTLLGVLGALMLLCCWRGFKVWQDLSATNPGQPGQ